MIDGAHLRSGFALLRRARPADFAEALAATCTATRVEWSLRRRRRRLPDLAQALGLSLRSDPANEPVPHPDRLALPEWAWRRARIADLVMSCWPFGNTCLRRALVMGQRLRAFAPELVIGVRPSQAPRAIDAHAWVRVQGVDLDPMARDYLEFAIP